MAHAKSFFFAMVSFAAIGLIIPASAETIQGKNYDDTLIGYDSNGNEIRQFSSHPERIYDNGWKDYRLTQNSTTILLETANSGSVAFSKSGCSYSFYDNGIIQTNDHPTVQDISYTVKGKANSSGTWSNVNSINNAACTPSIEESGNQVKIFGTKTNGLGTFQIELKYVPGKGIKETLKAYNNNPAWNNHNIGFTEKFQVPQVIKFGKNQYDLSQYNNTVLDRDWIINNKAKLIDLGNNMFYDFGIGFDNLQDLKITWINYKAYLSLNYLYGNYIVPYQQWIEVDPTLVVQDTSYFLENDAGASASCTTAGTKSKTAATANVVKASAADAGPPPPCGRAVAYWDITALPVTAIVTDTDVSFTSSGVAGMAAQSCDSFRVMNDPTTAAAALLWNDAEDGTQYVTANTDCRINHTYSLDFGATADSDIQASRAAGNTTFSISVKLTDESRGGAGAGVSFVNNAIDITITYTTAKPDAVTDLDDTDITTTTVDLVWTPPNMQGGTCSGYQINYTSPWGQPITILVNDTGSCTAAYDVSGLVLDTPYSFRVSARTQLGVNASGNILNVTTDAFNQANYTIGSFDFRANNPNIFPIRYERIDSGTQTLVNVTFTNSFIMACDLRYTYAQTNQTYYSISSIPVSASEDEASFNFLNSTNDIVTFHCWNQAGNQSANYVMTQTDFLLKQQVRDFRNGTYGTMGQFGAFDFITLIVVIIAMIGLNHKTEAVGGFFAIIAVAVLAYFEIVAWYTAIIAGLAVVILLAISSTRKD